MTRGKAAVKPTLAAISLRVRPRNPRNGSLLFLLKKIKIQLYSVDFGFEGVFTIYLFSYSSLFENCEDVERTERFNMAINLHDE